METTRQGHFLEGDFHTHGRGQVNPEGHKRVWRLVRPALVALDPVYAGDEAGFCAAYQRSEHAPDLRPWSKKASQ